MFDESVNGYPTTLRRLNVLPIHQNSLSGTGATVSFAGVPVITGSLAAKGGAGATLVGLPIATGTLAVTAAAPAATVVFAGIPSATGALAVTGAGTSVTIAGIPTITGALAATGAGTSVAIAGIPTITGALAATGAGTSVTLAGLASATGALAVQSGATATIAGLPTATGALAATSGVVAATVSVAGVAAAAGSLGVQSGAGVTLAGLAHATGVLTTTAAVTGTALDKPPPGSAINHAHPLAPRSATAVVFALLDSTVTTLVDDYNGRVMTNVGPAPVLTATPGVPGASTGPGLILSSVPGNISQFTNAGNPDLGADGYVTLAAIVKLTAYSAGGPRLIGAGTTGDVTLCPNALGTDVLNLLRNGLAFDSSGITAPLNHWVFFGASAKPGDHVDYWVYDYTLGSGTSGTVAETAMAAGDGVVAIGAIDQTHDTWGTQGTAYFLMVDYHQWLPADLQALAAAPFAMFGATPITVALAGAPAVLGALTATAALSGTVALAGLPTLTSTLTANALPAGSSTVRLVGTIPVVGAVAATPSAAAAAVAFAGQAHVTGSLTATTGTGLMPAYFQHYILARRD